MHRQWQFTVLCETKPCVIQEIGPVQILHLVFVELDYLPFWCWLAQVNLGSLHFNGHFPGGPGLAGTRMSPLWILLKQRMMEVSGGDNWNYKTYKTPTKSSPPTDQHPMFYMSDAFLSPNQQCQSAEGKRVNLD